MSVASSPGSASAWGSLSPLDSQSDMSGCSIDADVCETPPCWTPFYSIPLDEYQAFDTLSDPDEPRHISWSECGTVISADDLDPWPDRGGAEHGGADCEGDEPEDEGGLEEVWVVNRSKAISGAEIDGLLLHTGLGQAPIPESAALRYAADRLDRPCDLLIASTAPDQPSYLVLNDLAGRTVSEVQVHTDIYLRIPPSLDSRVTPHYSEEDLYATRTGHLQPLHPQGLPYQWDSPDRTSVLQAIKETVNASSNVWNGLDLQNVLDCGDTHVPDGWGYNIISKQNCQLVEEADDYAVKLPTFHPLSRAHAASILPLKDGRPMQLIVRQFISREYARSLADDRIGAPSL